MSPSLRRRHTKWRHFWRHSFLARVLSLGLSSGTGGLFVGGFIGLSNWISSGPFHPWWYWVGFTAIIVGLWAMFLGFVIGLILFSGVALASSRWSASRKRRFARGMKTRVFLPLAGSIILTSLAVAMMWIIQYHGLSLVTYDLGNILRDVEMIILAFSSCLFIGLLVFSSKHPRRKNQVRAERLLPLD